MKAYTTMILMLISVALLVAAEEPPAPILEKGDVQHFIETFPLLADDMEAFGVEYEVHDGTMTLPEALASNQEMFAILKKHGWDERFFQKAGVILLGYSSIVYGEEMKKADSSFAESLKELEANPNLSDDMKKQLREQMQAASSMMKTQKETFKQSIHPADLKLITPHIEEIREVVDTERHSEAEADADMED